ncbi:quinon protein alcohol dehydrogenase-like superfamily [Lactarius hengduanensis]|nr:quinon protein alcohol dehydrogenase-like superfamily [Lactarius hengduanensis]
MPDAIEQFMKKEAIQLLENVVEVQHRIEPISEPIISEETENPILLTCVQYTECLEGTRTAVLDDIFAWLKDPSGARIFWLSGIAGSGKSAVARSTSIRAALLVEHIVVSIFFSQFGHAGHCDPSSVFQTLAFQFSLLDIGYNERVSEVINEDPNIFEKDLRFQYEKLIIETLGAIHRPHGRILIILDGLDECEPLGATAILKVLLAEDVDHPKELKILTTGRPKVHLRNIFDAHSDIRKFSLEDVETENDIRHYLRTSFDQPPTRLVNTFTVPEETITELAKRAGNSFIYATTIIRFIFDEHSQDPRGRVDFLLSNRADLEEHPYARLDALFLGILQQALPLGTSDDEKHRLRTVLGLLVCLREPFPMDKMEAFYELQPGDVRRALHPLHSLVHVPDRDEEAPRIYHRSFTDFVVDPARCPDRNLVVDIGSNEKRIFNICSSLWNPVSTPITRENARAPDNNRGDTDFFTEGRYACLYWASHLTKIKDIDENTLYHLDDRCLLSQVRTWITSLKGQADKASNRLVDLMDNASRLLLHHATITSCDSLLIYDSALFTPAYLQVNEQLPPLVVEVRRNSHNPRFDDCEVVRHTDPVSSLVPLFRIYNDFMQVFAWSPNSRLIAVSRVNGIDIRDALSGSIVDSFDLSPSLENVLDPERVSRQCFTFYPDNSRIAYITRGGRVQVRNTLARTEEFAVTGHEAGLVSINVSPNGELLVSASNWGYIQVCNAENGDILWAVDTGTRLKSTSISPNSRLIVSLSYSRNYGVQIWNAIDGLPLITLPHDVISISFSPDSNQLASVDEEGLVRVWGTSQTTTAPIQEWSIGALPACLFFSPDGSKLAAAADDNVYILRRDADDFSTLDGHTGPVTSLAFSADGMTLASGSLDGTVRVWDASSIGTDTLRVVKDKQADWHDVSWSPRGQVVMASNFRESKVWIWNTQDGTSRVLEDCLPVAISDCGKYLATHSSSRTQNTETITTRRIASDVAQSISFSFSFKASPDSLRPKFFPNSSRFAAISGKEIFTWDASVAHPEVTRLVGHSAKLCDLHIVPDGSLLLSRAGGEVFAWDVDTLQLVSRTGNVIPRYHSPIIEAMEDGWVVMTLPDHGGPIRLFRLPSEYRPYMLSAWSITASWLSKCILVRSGNGNVFIVDISALPAATINLTN